MCFPCCVLQPLPTSLQALDATVAPVESFCQLRALQHLGLSEMVDKPSDPSFLTMLQQLTSLQLDVADLAELNVGDLADWSVFEGCTGLRTLHLGSASCLLRAAWVWLVKKRPAQTLLMHTV